MQDASDVAVVRAVDGTAGAAAPYAPAPAFTPVAAAAPSAIALLAPCGGTRVGNTLACGSCIVIGPDYMCNGVAWALIFGLSLAFLTLVAPRLHFGVVIANAATLAVLTGAFAVTSLADPGYLPRQTPDALAAQRAALSAGAAPAKGVVSVLPPGSGAAVDVAAANGFTACSVCHVLRERGTLHCYDCGRCVRDLDHHCPWSGKCIGAGNMLAFKTFLITLLFHCIFTGVAFVVWVTTRSVNG
jgi:hypothetical protein